MKEFPFFDDWANNFSPAVQIVMDCADDYAKTKTLFEAGTNGVTPVDMFDSWCQQRGSYEGSAWYKSWGMGAVHPEFVVIDRDGYVRDHHAGWSEAGMIACAPLVQQMAGF